MIGITGAAGKTGAAIINALSLRGAKVRALVRRESYRTELLKMGATEVFVGDMENGEQLKSFLEGVEQIYHICPNMHPQEFEIGKQMIDLAVRAGVAQFVYHSVLYPAIEMMPHHWQKMRVEEQLLRSGLCYTILQPTAYMQNLLIQWDRMKENNIYQQPYRVETKLSLVDLVDVGEAASIVLTDETYRYGVYQLCGTGGLSQLEVGAILGERLGRQIDVREIAHSDWEAVVRDQGMGAYQRENLLRMFRYYNQYDLIGNPQQLQMILRKSPRDLVSFVADLN